MHSDRLSLRGSAYVVQEYNSNSNRLFHEQEIPSRHYDYDK